jgi:nucleoid-associated protein YgaU
MKKYLLILSVLILTFALSGCFVDEELKQAVNEKNKLAESNFAQAQKNKAPLYAPKLYKQATEKLTDAKTKYQSNQLQAANESLDEYFNFIEKANKKALLKISEEKQKAEEAARLKTTEEANKKAAQEAKKKAELDAKIQTELKAKAAAEAKIKAEKSINYTVLSGDNLWTIAQKLNLNLSDIAKVYDKNNQEIKNTNLIYPGQKIIIEKK